MLDGPSVVQALRSCGITHVVWLPDSYLGAWEDALRSAPGLRLIRVAREGEAIALAAGLMIGGQRPIVLMQCTGFFEAGDALRNVVHDLKLPLLMIIGLRSWHAFRQKQSADTCPVFTEPILRAWQIPFTLLDDKSTVADLRAALQKAHSVRQAAAVVIGE
jgi:sulfopyruvate decarboxylase TPP-binding subunit